jgi:hypothetical protein
VDGEVAAPTVLPGMRTLARATAGPPGGALAGASAGIEAGIAVGTPPSGTAGDPTVAVPLAAGVCTGTVSESGGGTMPGARTNFGEPSELDPDAAGRAPSVGTVARPAAFASPPDAEEFEDDPEEAPAEAPVPAPLTAASAPPARSLALP